MTLVHERADATGKDRHVVYYPHDRRPAAQTHGAAVVFGSSNETLYRPTFDRLLERLPKKSACRLMVNLLALAHERWR